MKCYHKKCKSTCKICKKHWVGLDNKEKKKNIKNNNIIIIITKIIVIIIAVIITLQKPTNINHVITIINIELVMYKKRSISI